MDVLKNIIDQTPGNLYWKDKEGRYLGCNTNFAKVAGLTSPMEIVGKTDQELFLKQIGEDRVKALTDVDKKIIASGVARTIRETGIDSQNKLAFYISNKIPLRDENNDIIGIIGNSIESTAYDHIKDFIISNTTGNLYWKDTDGRYLGCNDAFAKMLGFKSAIDIIGKNDYEFSLNNDHVNKIIQTDKTVIKLNTELTVEEVGTNLDGKLANYISKKMPLKDVNGNIIGVVGTSIDITKQKQAEIVKAEFLKNMSHDIRTPLVGIYSLADILFNEETDPQKKEFLKDIVDSSERLNTLLNQILDISNVGAYEVCNTSFRIDNLIEESIGLLFAAMKLKKITYTLNNKEGVIKTDPVRLSRILSNILSNAVKFTPQYGSIHINVEIIQPILRIDIEDSGIGIPAEKLDYIFDKFTKLELSDVNQTFVGSGIGLYIAKHLASEIGGEIYVTSTLGKGSKFSIHIPSVD